MGCLLLLFNWITNLAAAQDFTRFISDTAESQTAYHILREPGGNLWLGGEKLGLNNNNLSVWLYRLNPEGEVLKRFRFPFGGFQTWVGMDWVAEGQLGVVMGQKGTNGITENWLAIVDSNQIISRIKINGADDAILDDVNADGLGNLLACGYKSSPGIAGNDFWVGKIGSNGVPKWIYNEGLTPNDHIRMAKTGPDGFIYVSGDVQNSSYNPYVAKLDTNGNLVWETVLLSDWNDGAQKFDFDETGRLWLMGESSTSAGPLFDNALSIVSADGNLEWQQWIGSSGQDAAFVIHKKQAGSGFWVGGYSNAGTGSMGPISPYLMELDGAGNSLGEAFWPFSNPSPVYDMEVIGDSVFYFCGVSNTSAYFMRRIRPALSPIFVVKNNGALHQNAEPLVHDPFSGTITLSADLQWTDFQVFNQLGQLRILANPSGEKEISLAGFSSGVYFVKATTANGKQVAKKIWVP